MFCRNSFIAGATFTQRAPRLRGGRKESGTQSLRSLRNLGALCVNIPHLRSKCLLSFLVILSYSGIFAQSQTKRALFIGNSYTYVNNLPQLVADVASSTGDTLFFDSYTIGGYTLDQHLADTNCTNKIRAGGWDYVILQDQSEVPALPDYSGAGAVGLSALIREFNPCARALFYMTWGHKNGDVLNCPTFPPVCTYEGMDSLLRISYMDMAFANHAQVSPVSSVWKFIRQNFPSIELFQPDDSHPSLYGSYAAACSFYTSIFANDPTTISFDFGLPAGDAAIIRAAAKNIVFDSISNFYFPDDLPIADFHYYVGTGTNEVHLVNESQHAENYLWDFGDGNFSTNENPVHNYGSDGTYLITLTSSGCDLSQIFLSTFQQTITFCPFNPIVTPDSVLICPNRDDTLWTQPFDSYQWFDDHGDSISGETHQFLHATISGNFSVLAMQNGCAEISPPVAVISFQSLQSFAVNITGASIFSINSDTACVGDTIQLVLLPNKPPFPDDRDVQWFNNGFPVSAGANDTILVTSSGNYEVRLVDSTYCPGNIIYMSPVETINFVNCQSEILEDTSRSGVRVFPNPSELFTVELSPQLAGIKYSVVDVLGRTQKVGIFEKELNILDIREFKKGIYFLKLERQTIKLVTK